MNPIDYKKVYSKLSHIKALSHDQKFDQIVQNLITHTLNQKNGLRPKNERELTKKINDTYGISIRSNIVISNIDKLISSGGIIKDANSKEYFVSAVLSKKLSQRLEESEGLEKRVKDNWFKEIKDVDLITIDPNENLFDNIWECITTYMCNVFEQHGVQTLQILNPGIKISDDDQESLTSIIDNIAKEYSNKFDKSTIINLINHFFIRADEERAKYISQLADSTFTSFALTSDAATVNFLNQRYNDLHLFLDTNFIFGVLDLHKNSEDASAREIAEEVKKNNLPFKLTYHPETLAEFRRAFDARAMHIRASKWTSESSRVAITVDGLSPLEELFHKQNLENEIDPSVFLDKYDHVDLLLQDLGLSEYRPGTFSSDEEYFQIDNDIEKYQTFYESIPYRKAKSFLGFKHDIVVLREVRKLNPKKTKFLESNAFFISSDYILSKFEKTHYKRNWEINYVVTPSVFLQLIRPFIENDYSSNKRFIETFSIPEIRAFDIDYSTTRSKTLQILNDSYHETSFETKVKILRDQVILDKLGKANDNYQKQVEIIENQIAIENQILTTQKEEALANIKTIEGEKNIAISTVKIKEKELLQKKDEIDKLKTTYEFGDLKRQIEFKNDLLSNITKSILANEKREESMQRKIEKKMKLYRFFFSLIPIGYFLIMATLVNFLKWEVMEPITYIASIALVLIGYIYAAINGESFNPTAYFKSYKDNIEKQVHEEFNFDVSEYKNEKNEKTKLEEEIKQLEDKLSSINN